MLRLVVTERRQSPSAFEEDSDMRTLMNHFFTAALIAVPLSVVACGSDDDDKPSNPSTGGTSGSGGSGGGTGGATGGSSGAGTGGATGGAAGTGGAPACDLSGTGKAKETLPATITADMTLDNTKVYVLEGITHVADGATITIPPCTRIEGKKGPPPGTLVISRGAKIMAVGTANEPILFTSENAAGSRSPGDWGGVVLLGKAANFNGANVTMEGLSDAPENQYGGTEDADNSGSMSFVRIEYSGFEVSPDNEINGLTLGSVGSGTTIDHVMVSNTLDDGFEWFGGTVAMKYLVVNNAGDDMFDGDQGWRGSIQFAFGRQVVPITANPNGFEMDSDLAGAKTPESNIKVSNVTMCGAGATGTDPSFGMVLRERVKGNFMNVFVTKFDTGVDVRDNFGDAAAPNIPLANSAFFEANVAANTVGNPAETDNDMGFDEAAWFTAGAGNSQTKPGGFGDCHANPPDVAPTAMVPGGTPGAGFDTTANYQGAFKDKTDAWMTGLWVDWAEN